VANPDPVWFPNGIGDAVFAICWSLDGWGDAFVYVTSRYADGYPQAWTVLDPAYMTVESRRGRRAYRYNQTVLNSDDMLQISRDPRPGDLRGTSALKSYSGQAYGLMAASDLGRVMMQSDVPQYALKAQRKVTKEQAEALQLQWMTRTAARRGAPPVMPPDIDLEKLGFSVADLMLLDAQKFSAQVIATAYGVPAQMINMAIDGGLTYSTPVLMLEAWWRSSLRPKAFRISRALSSVMLPAGSYVEFDAREFLAPTYADLADALAKLVPAGILSTEEARTILLNAPPEGVALADLATPPSAGASPAQIPSTSVVALRPTGTVT
jgi:HK97 family phage portal protein